MYRSNWVTPGLLLFLSLPANAWDPFTLAAGAQAISGASGGYLGGGLGDLADASIALGDLLVELDIDPTADQEAEDAVRRLESLRRTVNETRWTKQEVDHLLDFEQLKAKSHADRIRHLRKMIQMSRKIASLFGVRAKAAEKANQIQQTQINYLMLEEMMAARRARFNEFLERQDQLIRRKSILEKIQEQEKQQREDLWSQYRSRRKS
jgi:hypothetical protein